MAVSRGIRIRFRDRIARVGIKDILLYAVMICLVAFTALPLIYVISTAFKPYDEIMKFPPQFFVRRPTLNNFEDLVVALSGSSVPFLRYVYNSVVTTAATVFPDGDRFLHGRLCAGQATRSRRKVLFTIIIMALMFPER